MRADLVFDDIPVENNSMGEWCGIPVQIDTVENYAKIFPANFNGSFAHVVLRDLGDDDVENVLTALILQLHGTKGCRQIIPFDISAPWIQYRKPAFITLFVDIWRCAVRNGDYVNEN